MAFTTPWRVVGSGGLSYSSNGIFVGPSPQPLGSVTLPSNSIVVFYASSQPGSSLGGSIQTWGQPNTDGLQLTWINRVTFPNPNSAEFQGGYDVWWAQTQGGGTINIEVTTGGIVAEIQAAYVVLQGGNLASPFLPGFPIVVSGTNTATSVPNVSTPTTGAFLLGMTGQFTTLNWSPATPPAPPNFPAYATGWRRVAQEVNPDTSTNPAFARGSQLCIGTFDQEGMLTNATVPVLVSPTNPNLTTNTLVLEGLDAVYSAPPTPIFPPLPPPPPPPPAPPRLVGVPCVIGFTYASRGQLPRGIDQRDIGAANGPGLGKKRRHHMVAALLAGAVYGTISFGTLFTRLRPAYFVTRGQQPIPTNQLFSGVYWSTVDDDYSFDGQLCWEIARPLPATLTMIEGFIQTQDR